MRQRWSIGGMASGTRLAGPAPATTRSGTRLAGPAPATTRPAPAGPEPLSLRLGPLFRIQADLCKALGSQHRLAILCCLRDGEMAVGDLALSLGIPAHSVSQHLQVLREHGTVQARKSGRAVFYAVTSQKLWEACRLMGEAIVEQHHAEDRSLLAAELLDGVGPTVTAAPAAPLKANPEGETDGR